MNGSPDLVYGTYRRIIGKQGHCQHCGKEMDPALGIFECDCKKVRK